MGRKKKASTQPEEEQLQTTAEQIPTTPDVEQSSEDSIGGETNNNQTGVENGSSTNVDGNTNKEPSTDGTSTDFTDFATKLWQEHKKRIEELGGYEAVQKRLELSKSILLHYRLRGKTLEEIVESVLQEFREEVAKYGYVGVKKEMLPIIAHYGTIKDKVALIVNAHFDMQRSEDPILSRKQADDIRAEVRTQGRDAMVEFMNYLSLFDTLRSILPQFYRAKYSYLAMAFQSTIYFQTYEWLSKAEELFNRFSSLVDPNKQAEFRQLAKEYNSYLQSYQRFGELDEKSGGKWVDEQIEDCLSYAEIISTDFCKERLSQAKAAIEAIEAWVSDNQAELFLSMELREQMIALKTESIQELQDKYCYSHLHFMEERGETPTEADRKIALFPSYEEVERNEGTYKFFYNKLDGYKETYK